MATEQFSVSEFESALPSHNKTGAKLWTSLGHVKGEMCYQIDFGKPNVKIFIRSSIDSSGFAASAGQDSIRAWLTDDDGNPLGMKVQAYVTRVKGWQERLLAMLRKLAKIGTHLNPCPVCGEMLRMSLGKGANKGKVGVSCWKKNSDGTFANHVQFSWVNLNNAT